MLIFFHITHQNEAINFLSRFEIIIKNKFQSRRINSRNKTFVQSTKFQIFFSDINMIFLMNLSVIVNIMLKSMMISNKTVMKFIEII